MNIFIIGVDFKYERRNTFVVSDRQARKRKKTRQAILEASRVLLLERGLDATTMSAVAEAADVATGTLYNYFPSKDALLVGLWTDATSGVLDQADQRVAQAGQTPQAQCTALLRLYCEAVTVFAQPLTRELFARTFAVPPEALLEFASLDAQLMARLTELLEQWRVDGALVATLDLEAATTLLYAIAVTQMMSLMALPALTLDDAETSIRAQVSLAFSGLESAPTNTRPKKGKQP